ncbi:hypothetical protein [Paraburkholderia sediminicola]|uniref:hypothetical protein n=1 Tax=Paraburkholderia sediminicola TaxID=458836 RepID=UPI0038B744F7
MSTPFKPTMPLRCPARIFLELWREAVADGTAYLTNSIAAGSSFQGSLQRALAQDDINVVCESLERLRACRGIPGPSARGRKLAIMDAIDQMYLAIHPRTLVPASSRLKRVPLPKWLADAAQLRVLADGWYVEDGLNRVIARGPIRRRSRALESVSADSIPDRFSALSVVPKTLPDSNGRQITIGHQIITSSGLYGVDPAPNPGAEKIVFVPVLESRAELTMDHRARGGVQFVDCRAGAGINPSERIIGALEKESEIVIAIAPEFTVTETQANELAVALLKAPTQLAKLIVAGSGQTIATDESLPWNEARALNGFGKPLWRQRKLWPAAILRDRAIEFGLPDPGPNKIFEDTAAGSELLIVDVDHLGRFAILICQDLVNPPIASDMVRQFQPDWVVSPILDRGTDLGRWAHKASFNMSVDSRTRFLIACSTALAPTALTGSVPQHCALAVGPCDQDDDDEGRLVAALSASTVTPTYAVVTWRSDEKTWKKSTLSAN